LKIRREFAGNSTFREISREGKRLDKRHQLERAITWVLASVFRIEYIDWEMLKGKEERCVCQANESHSLREKESDHTERPTPVG